MARKVLALVVVMPFLGGCLSSLGSGEDSSGEVEPGMPSLDVDLHDYVVNITMPEGQPTMLVALNVSKDHWVRPFFGVAAELIAPAQAPTHWVLCPWVDAIGLPDIWRYTALPFWLRDGVLSPAAPYPFGVHGRGSADGKCVAWYGTQVRDATIWADEPHEGILVIAFSAWTVLDESRSAESIEAFHVLTGVARAVCQDDATRLCPPTMEMPAMPIAYGTASTFAIHHVLPSPGEPSNNTCNGCGIEFVDDTNKISFPACPLGNPCGVQVGSVAARRSGPAGSGIIHAHAFHDLSSLDPFADQRPAIELTVQGGKVTSRVACRTAEYADIFVTLAYDSAPTTYANFSVAGSDMWGIDILEVPISLPTGWVLPPAAVAATRSSEHAGTQAGLCD